MTINVDITDDHPLAINGIRMMLEDEPDIHIAHTYTTGAALKKGLASQQPDVLLLDVKLVDEPGSEVAAFITRNYPEVRIVALTSLDAPAVVKNMMRNGCIGYLLKGTDRSTLIETIRKAYYCEEFLDPALHMHMRHVLSPSNETPELTKREKEILKLIVAGDSTQEIAEKLCISPRTAEVHRLTLLKKLDVKNTAGLVRIALTLGLVI